MRKRIIAPALDNAPPLDDEWLDLDALAEVELTSEDAAHPIEFALLHSQASGWRASEPGNQSIRILFERPQPLKRIWLEFAESRTERTQEHVLRWSPDRGATFRDIVRQQWNFSPQGATSEIEDYHVELAAVTVLELTINPDISGGIATASLETLRIA